ncbi:3-oxoacid CoA-transferase subunit B [Texcoconibacillus texcoconensis]|uniref:Acetate CoA/acetoacetate CoA-transferase beta subunit n=1 Tax=Texcoconibacillus texcoconensis TaxID=1095777 RepID=A0A840QP63_9BACI|nr:3-oxoacid CoA-transferase subunit B [Texcoconibacillus texcoconensis]MBB5173160.1 acetate CoA/acetoacetate CoA-transferase beta subunit [Texcoconibacillus texcoconensis]
MTEVKTAKETIAERVAKELKDGDVINLGIGLPTKVPKFLPKDVDVIIQSENGYIGLGPVDGEEDPDLVDAGGQPAGIQPGGAMFDSAFSFELIRGGHVDATVLGGLEVDKHGNIANWMVPGKMVPGMGGAMDLVTGAKKVIVAMEHCNKKGASKILDQCQLPLTGKAVVDMIVTELAVFRVIDDELVLVELQDGVDLETVREKTEAYFELHPDFKIEQTN